MTSAHISEISDRTFFLILCIILPIGLGSGIVLFIQFVPPFIMNCGSDQVCNTNMSILKFMGYGMGILVTAFTFRTNYKNYKDSNYMYKALDIQNDKCFTCGLLIKPDDEFYYYEKHVYCINHKKGVKVD